MVVTCFYTPPKTKMELANASFEKEKLLYKLSILEFHVSFPGCDYLDDVAPCAPLMLFFFLCVFWAQLCRVSGSQDECQNGCLARTRCKFNQPLGCQGGNRFVLSSLGQQHVFLVCVQGPYCFL